jgi:transcriptional regulator with XRE-family HTH domain
MAKPSPKELSEAVGISPSYASMILSGDRSPARPLAIAIFRKLGWKHSIITDLTDEQMRVLEQVEPWERAA